MAQELAYVIITPYSLHKSRTGGILARLITRTGLELTGARMFAPSAELVSKYSDVIVSADDPQDRSIQELIRSCLAMPTIAVCKTLTLAGWVRRLQSTSRYKGWLAKESSLPRKRP